MNLMEIAILFFCVLLGGGAVLVIKSSLIENTRLLLSFSAAYLLALCLLHLLPEVFYSDLKVPGAYILLGFLLQIILEYFSQGLEHGHSHVNSSRFPIAVVLSLLVHAFIEGMPFGAGHAHDHMHAHNHSLLTGIVLHKIPISIVLASMLLKAKFSKLKILLALTIFALMSPLGAISLHFIEGSSLNLGNLFPMTTGILIGVLLHVATTIIFESSDGHKFNAVKFISILAGLGLAWLTL